MGNLTAMQGMKTTPCTLRRVTGLETEATFMDNQITNIRKKIAPIGGLTTKGDDGQIRTLGEGMTTPGISLDTTSKATTIRRILIKDYVTRDP